MHAWCCVMRYRDRTIERSTFNLKTAVGRTDFEQSRVNIGSNRAAARNERVEPIDLAFDRLDDPHARRFI